MDIQFNLDEIEEVAKKLLGNTSFKTLCFYGSMGAGKTTLIKALVKELGASEPANSPTFGIVNEYYKQDGSLLAYHFDFYRLEDETEALDLGLEDYLNQDVWIFMEWPEKIKSFLPEDAAHFKIETVDNKTRKLNLD